MNFDLILAIVFYLALLIFFFKNRKKFEVQGGIFALYRTKLGLKLMDKISKKLKWLLNVLSYISVGVGFLGMTFILYYLFKGTYNLIFIPKSVPVVAPVLPGVQIAGLPVLSFWHWIIALFIVAVVHEFMHGVYARLYKVKIKSSGFAFLGPILAAFVEPNEKQVSKISTFKQLSILSAGPFINIVLAFIVLFGFSFIVTPLESHLLVPNGVTIMQVAPGSPANLSGLYAGLNINAINNIKINSQDQLASQIQKSGPNDILKVATNKGDFYVKPNSSSGKPVIGVTISENFGIKQGWPEFLLPSFLWINLLFFWLWVVNFGIGLINLLPMGPIDGGRMLQTFLLGITKKKRALAIFKIVTFVSLALILINLLPYIIKLFAAIFGLFS